jgi:hypothetical protein
MEITTPEGWRKGQTLFNFLEWLAKERGYEDDPPILGMNNTRMADPFYIEDNKLDALYEEFILEYS